MFHKQAAYERGIKTEKVLLGDRVYNVYSQERRQYLL